MFAARLFKHPIGLLSLFVILLFALIGIYAPFLASSKPLFVIYDGQWYFPLFRYLFYKGFYSSYLDLFFNLLMFFLPFFFFRVRTAAFILFLLFYGWIVFNPIRDPAVDTKLVRERIAALKDKSGSVAPWEFTLKYMNAYAKLDAVLSYLLLKAQDARLEQYGIATRWDRREENLASRLEGLKESPASQSNARIAYIEEREKWLQEQSAKVKMLVMPLIRPFHWEEDAGGEQALNAVVPFYELTRVGRKDLTAALIFGIRISLVVGVAAVGLALLIGIPVGALAGYYGGKWDIIVCRLMEIWESMPTFFMLLLVVSVTQSRSIFLVISVIGLFGWMGASRFIRGEFFKQRSLPYIEACHAMGYGDSRIIFRHILPNAIPPLLTLLPFSIMGAITAEAGLSFLGLGETGSCSWGVLMDEGRRAFPGESYLLWPPAILLTILLIAIALLGDALRDLLDPKLRN